MKYNVTAETVEYNPTKTVEMIDTEVMSVFNECKSERQVKYMYEKLYHDWKVSLVHRIDNDDNIVGKYAPHAFFS